MRLTAKEFIDKYGTDGLREAIGNNKTGDIMRGYDYASVSELSVILNLFN